MRLEHERLELLVDEPHDLVVHAKATLLLYDFALSLQHPVGDGQGTHPVRLEVQDLLQRLSSKLLVVHRHVVGGVGV